MTGNEPGDGDTDPRPGGAAPWLVDLVLGIAMALAVAVTIAADPNRGGVAAYLFAIGFGALILLRRRTPRIMLVLTVLGIFTYYALGLTPIGMALPAAAALYSAAEQRRTWWAVGAGAVLVAVATFFRLSDPEPGAGLTPYDLVTNLALVAASIALGVAVRLTLQTREQAARLAALTEAERELAVRHQVQEERVRLARDLHDRLGHELTVVALHAGVAAESVGQDDTAARKSLGHVRTATSGALGELRSTVKLLRGSGPLSGSEPGLAAVDQLAESARNAGITVSVDISVPPGRVSTAVDTVAYQIVQESLTNVIRHANAQHATVRAAVSGERLEVVITDDGATTENSVMTGKGAGISGMTERAEMLGGRVTAGPRSGRAPGARGFEVRAELPIEATP